MTERAPDIGKGNLFRNNKKTSDRQPDFRGSATVGGERYVIAGWTRVSERTGQKFLHLSFRSAPADTQAKAKVTLHETLDDDVIRF